MKKTHLFASSIILGSVIGFFVGLASRCPVHILILLTLNGTFFGYFLGIALFGKQYRALVWGVMAVIIALIVDWIAGSTRVSLLDKLAFAMAGLFIGIDFRFYWKQALIVGCIGGLLGFLWGMTQTGWFGYALLEPGLWNALLFSVKCFVFGMFLGSVYMGVRG